MQVAILGLGRMGQALATRLVGGGHAVAAWNRTPRRAPELRRAGVEEEVDLTKAVERADVVLSSLADDGAVRAVALGEKGVRASIGKRLYVEASTISPALSEELAARFDRFLSMPVLGAPSAVMSGHATYLVGGAAEEATVIAPLIEALGGHVKHFADAPKAATAKLAVNLMLLSAVATLAESFAVGRAGGLGDGELRDLFEGSPVVAPGLRNRFDALLSGGGAPWWTTTLGAKDAGLAVDAARRGDRELRVGPAIRDAYRAAADAGHAEEDITAVADLFR